jgi:hypothetical protein
METIDNPSGIDVRGTMLTKLDKNEVDRIYETAPDLLQAIFEAMLILNCSLEELEFDLRDFDIDSLANVHLNSAKDSIAESVEVLKKAVRLARKPKV